MYCAMRPSSIRIRTRFFVALFVLTASLVAVGGLGLRGPRDVQHANDQVFADNLVTAKATSIGDDPAGPRESSI
jgi:Tar ligand binding domain homologue